MRVTQLAQVLALAASAAASAGDASPSARGEEHGDTDRHTIKFPGHNGHIEHITFPDNFSMSDLPSFLSLQECPIGTFQQSVTFSLCPNLTPLKGPTTPEMCRGACCHDSSCEVWQWCPDRPDGPGCPGYAGVRCHLGMANSSAAYPCPASLHWFGESRTTRTVPIPPANRSCAYVAEKVCPGVGRTGGGKNGLCADCVHLHSSMLSQAGCYEAPAKANATTWHDPYGRTEDQFIELFCAEPGVLPNPSGTGGHGAPEEAERQVYMAVGLLAAFFALVFLGARGGTTKALAARKAKRPKPEGGDGGDGQLTTDSKRSRNKQWGDPLGGWGTPPNEGLGIAALPTADAVPADADWADYGQLGPPSVVYSNLHRPDQTEFDPPDSGFSSDGFSSDPHSSDSSDSFDRPPAAVDDYDDAFGVFAGADLGDLDKLGVILMDSGPFDSPSASGLLHADGIALAIPSMALGELPGGNTGTTNRPFSCTVKGCGYTATRRQHLIEHAARHTGARPHKCEHPGCTYATSTKGHLVRHKRVHSGEKRFGCDWQGCNFVTSEPIRLTEHRRAHTGERPYVCAAPGCAYATTRSWHLTRHKQSQHAGLCAAAADGSAGDRMQALPAQAKPFPQGGETFSAPGWVMTTA